MYMTVFRYVILYSPSILRYSIRSSINTSFLPNQPPKTAYYISVMFIAHTAAAKEVGRQDNVRVYATMVVGSPHQRFRKGENVQDWPQLRLRQHAPPSQSWSDLHSSWYSSHTLVSASPHIGTLPGGFGFDVGGVNIGVVGKGGRVDGSVPLVGIEQCCGGGGRGEHELLLLFGALADVTRLATARRAIRKAIRRYGKEVFMFVFDGLKKGGLFCVGRACYCKNNDLVSFVGEEKVEKEGNKSGGE